MAFVPTPISETHDKKNGAHGAEISDAFHERREPWMPDVFSDPTNALIA